MQKNKYQGILYFIAAVILVTLTIQVYWNFKNYQTGKQQLIKDVQVSLDNSVDQYYEELTKKKIDTFFTKTGSLTDFLNNSNLQSYSINLDSILAKNGHNSDEIDYTKFKGITIFKGDEIDSISNYPELLSIRDSIKATIEINQLDSINSIEPFKRLTSKMIISLKQSEIELGIIDSLLKKELLRKRINVDYGLTYGGCVSDEACQDHIHQIIDTSFIKSQKLNTYLINDASLTAISKSTYLPPFSQIKIYFTNTTLTILKKNLIGILLSFLLVGSVIGCLLYLFRIINQQKQLAELKNDLISNITHEFKTPIATISVALEGIQNFNAENDPEKTKKYVEMSSKQLVKLNTMVEKILETATLDSEKLQLNLEEINLAHLAESVAERFKTNSEKKDITFHSSYQNIWKKVDAFHLENAINNIVDNAVKYGGDSIEISIINSHPNIILEIKDNGTSLTKAQKDNIFKKFYRVPKGNTHDIKGFGIGLFYTKTIIEKHEGTIELVLDQKQTNFKIKLPNG